MIINNITLNLTDDGNDIEAIVFGDGSVHFPPQADGGGIALSFDALAVITDTVDFILDSQDDGDDDIDTSSEDAYDGIDGEDTGVPGYPADNLGNTSETCLNQSYDSFYR